MANRLRDMLYPPQEVLQKQYDLTNEFIRKTHEKYGDCCAICKHSVYVQQSCYYDYITCEHDKTIEFGYGEGWKEHVCDKYEFCGYLKLDGGDKDAD